MLNPNPNPNARPMPPMNTSKVCRPIKVLRCHPETFRKEFTDKGKRVVDRLPNGHFDDVIVQGHPQNYFWIDDRMPVGFFCAT